jgi:hypothetical protein
MRNPARRIDSRIQPMSVTTAQPSNCSTDRIPTFASSQAAPGLKDSNSGPTS